MENLEFKTVEEVAQQYHMSEVSQWRYRKAGDLDYYRVAGKILYTPQQLFQFFETRRQGSKSRHARELAAA